MKPIFSLILIITMAALCIGCGSARSLAATAPGQMTADQLAKLFIAHNPDAAYEKIKDFAQLYIDEPDPLELRDLVSKIFAHTSYLTVHALS